MENKTPDQKLLLMPKPLAAEQQTTLAEAEPPETSNSPLAFSGPLTRESLTEYTELQHLRHAKKIVPRIYRTLQKGLDGKGLDSGEMKALEFSMETYGLRSKGSGVTIINNLLQQNNGGSSPAERKQEVYFEGLIRGMDQEDQVKSSGVILDAEEVD